MSSNALAQGQETREEEVLLSADEITHDETLNLVTASGNVELARGNRVLLADRITYNQRTKIVTATGNVRLIEPSGEVVFSEYTELKDDLAEGFADQIRLLMADGGRMAANEGERTNGGRFLRMNRVVYSPCDLCQDDPTRAPVWQLRAARVVHDKETKDIVYRDAILEMFGVPVFYTPYFSHPDPTVERRTGLLPPTFALGGNLGTAATTPFYWSIDPSYDLTLTPTVSAEDGLMLRGEWRQRFEAGELWIDGSIVNADRDERAGDTVVTREDQWRGHLFAHGLVNLDETWRTGFDVQTTTDETYLRRYDIYSRKFLTSRAYLEGFRDRDYATVEAFRFQDLRTVDIPDRRPIVPLAEASLVGDPGEALGGRWTLDLGLASVLRKERQDTQRLSAAVGWEREFRTEGGLITTLDLGARVDTYYVSNFVRDDAISPSDHSTETAARFHPEAQVTVRYPLVRDFGSFQSVIEPMASLITSPDQDPDRAIPNDDSLNVALDATSLFRPNRFAGVDRLETGTRAVYGFNTGVYGNGGGSTELFLGQSYRLIGEAEYPAGSGLEDDRSDLVAQLRIRPNEYLNVHYDTRFDEEDFSPRYHELRAQAGVPLFRVGATYFYQPAEMTPLLNRTQEYLGVSASSNITDYWGVSLSRSWDMEGPDKGPLSSGAVLTYSDECFTFQVIGTHSEVEDDPDLDADTTVYFRLAFKNLGEFSAPAY